MYEQDRAEKASVSTRETEISRVVGRLREAATDLEETAKSFHARLEGIALKDGLRDNSEEARTPEFGTNLGRELDNIHNRIYKAGKSLHDLLGRIEL